ncbi:primosomal protein N' [Thermoanaerobacterium sp. RBIITD]|uniref:primosomal protein N' n=1 Tax=Thermoanaerobacterium sp. RBIITD TaxID=1550240 RepID=UPI000BB67E0D|nr:primosomal protein N' [Thermoanaerobacterium sp. RBIITD]SNX55599.1 replication restart DNA helicase PriA [Thermoanaerobacterium sp. RBIITD]
MFAQIVLNEFSRNTEKVFTYKIPENMKNLEIGMRVSVPINKSIVEGYIIKITNYSEIPDNKLKYIINVLDDYSIFDEKMLKLAFWMKDYYNCFLSESLQCIIPTGIKKGEKKVKKVKLKKEFLSKIKEDFPSRQLEILNFLSNKDSIYLSDLIRNLNVSYSSVYSLYKKGFIDIFYEEVDRFNVGEYARTKKLAPTKEQEYVISKVKDSIERGLFDKYLLFGVTGSGKTEVYLQLIEKCIDMGKDAIVLVPEISLTPQTIERFISRFGNLVAVLHSGLSRGERFDEWRRIKKGEVKVAVGVRNAIFAPFSNIGLIIIDEEHENTYKQSDFRPKYNVKEVAEKRCEIEKAVLLLGSATPQIESFYRALKNEYKLLRLKDRIGIELPRVEVVNMSKELAEGNNSIFSRRLYKEIKLNLIKGEQTILFLNRRGYSSFVSCRDCGYVPKCPNCDISLTYHAFEGKLKCHYCGYNTDMVSICPKCKSKRIRYLGIGTERIEKDIKKLFPKSKVLRMDVDTTKTKGSHEKIFYEFKKGNADILIGTQMISKGFDIPNVTLVGVILADVTLNIPDFRSGERTFQLLTQVAGRAGRGTKPGRVIIQTYEDDNYSILAAKNQDYEKFYKEEIHYREIFKYPPFTHLMNIVIYGDIKNDVIDNAARLYNIIYKTINKSNKKGYNKILGPSSAPIERIKNNYRWQIIVKSSDRGILLDVANVLNTLKIQKNIKISFDLDPISII